MDRLPVELIYLLVFGAIIVFNYVMQQVAKRRQSETREQLPQDEPLPESWGRDPSTPAHDESTGLRADYLPEIWGRAPASPALLPVPVERAVGFEAPDAAATIPRRHSAVRSLFGSRGELRHVIVAMTVLGPCRALEPPASEQSRASIRG